MPLQLRIVAVLAAAVVAASAHHKFLESRLDLEAFVATSRPLRAGQQVDERDLLKIELSGNLPLLTQQFLPWQERLMLVNTKVTRDFHGGELFRREEAEVRALSAYQAKPNEYVFTLQLPETDSLKNRFGIGSKVGFIIEHQTDSGKPARIEHCGPFAIRQIDGLSKQLDPSLMRKAPTASITLSLPKAPGGIMPALAHTLLSAVNGHNGSTIVALYDPTTT